MQLTQSRDGVSLTQLVVKEQEREQRIFRLKVVVSWIALFAILLFLFSGLRLGDFHTIQLDGSFIQEWAPFISEGVVITLEICFVSILFASILALLAALGRLSHIAPLYALSTFYVSLIRGTPLLLQIFFFFLALPQLGIVLPGFVAGTIALSLNYGAYMSEIFRAGIQGVGKGQREAALALGMTSGQTMRRIVLPQAIRRITPVLASTWVSLFKDTSLVSVIAVTELAYVAMQVRAQTFRVLEMLTAMAVIYWLLGYPQAKLVDWIERRWSVKE